MSKFKGTNCKQIIVTPNEYKTWMYEVTFLKDNGLAIIPTKEEAFYNAKRFELCDEMVKMLQSLLEKQDKGSQTYLDLKDFLQKVIE